MFPSLRLIDDCEPRGAAMNMAVDEALLLNAPAPLLRVYRWKCPAVSFGYFEHYEVVTQLYPHLELVRRWTGGGIVPHGEDTTYSLIAPRSSRFFNVSVSESYRLIHEAVARVLARPGIELRLAGEGTEAPSHGCFERAVRCDVVSGHMKVAGAAQRRSRAGLLHQGSIQNIAVPRTFSQLLAQELSAEIVARSLVPNEVEAAVVLCDGKYGTDAWLKRL